MEFVFPTFVVSYNDIVGCIIARERELLGLSQAKLAKKVQMSPASLGKIEQGKVICTTEHLFNICHFGLGKTPTYVINLADKHVEGAKVEKLATAANFLESGVLKRSGDVELLKCFRGLVLVPVLLGPAAWPATGRMLRNTIEVFKKLALLYPDRIAAFSGSVDESLGYPKNYKAAQDAIENALTPWIEELLRNRKDIGEDLPDDRATEFSEQLNMLFDDDSGLMLLQQSMDKLELGLAMRSTITALTEVFKSKNK
jgi:transcriptional regulator with XRE-family HTH domain